MSAPGKLVRSSRWKSGPSKGQRPLGSECCVTACGNRLPFGPEVGAVCGKAARTVLCGGRAMKRTSLPLLGWMAPLRHRRAKLVF